MHFIFKKTLKYVSIILAALLLIFIYYIIYFKENKEKILQLSENEKKYTNKLNKNQYSVTIEDSIFRGRTNDNLPYTIYSDSTDKSGDNIFLKTVKAKCKLNKDDSFLTINSPSALFDNNNKNILFKNNTKAKFDDIDLFSKNIYFTLDDKKAYSEENTTIYHQKSIIKANNFETDNSCKVINLKGNVVFTIDIKDNKNKNKNNQKNK